jgi:hypothetical protein
VAERGFDLNIERVLDNWTVAHALREVIANALDEQALTGTGDPEIGESDDGTWQIRDRGRGLRYEHLTQNENKEKLEHPNQVVGKFGVGLKDALATFDRHHVDVTIRSKHCDIRTGKRAKHDFADITTLHALVDDPSDPELIGTEFILSGAAVNEQVVADAKSLFLRYAGDETLGMTDVGWVLQRASKAAARIYVNGLRIAEEDNFLFSYNITSPTKALRQALNRERSHVGRSAYSDRVKAILLRCDSEPVIEALVVDLARFERGTWHDETQWLDVGIHACQQLNARHKVIFLMPMEMATAPVFVKRAADDGYRIVTVPENIRRKLSGLMDAAGEPIRDLTEYRRQWSDSFQFQFVDPKDFTPPEASVWNALPMIFALHGERPDVIRDVRVSETMRLMPGEYQEANGLWDPNEGWIVVKRSQLRTLRQFAGTVLHEVTHAVSDTEDVSLEFEVALTDEIGTIAERGLDGRA